MKSATAKAVSPDSRLLAVACRTEEKGFFGGWYKAHVALYDVATGKEVSRVLYEQKRIKRDDPFAAARSSSPGQGHCPTVRTKYG